MSTFESLPVELIADILGELDLTSLVLVAYLSRRLKDIASDPSLNPWRRPILRALRAPTSVDNEAEYEPVLRQLSVRQIVPRHNWVEILSLGKPEYLLFEMTLPNLKETEWEECFRRRFLPGWVKWKTTSWKAAFLKILHRTWHRSHSSCTADEGWTKYILLNRNGSANLLEASSRSYGPMAVFHEIKLQNNLAHLPTHVRLVVEFRDVRIIALGVLSKPRSSFSVNQNARAFLHPPGVTKGEDEGASSSARSISEGSDESFAPPAADPGLPGRGPATPFMLRDAYRPLIHPLPSSCHANYPLYTSGGEDKRWMGNGEMEENGRQWVGPMLITAQLVGPQTKQQPADIFLPLQDLDLIAGPGRNQYASLTWEDLTAVAPWLELTNMINGAGLGH
ncbi:uncharacterized protein BXZ73DRAFT_97285 [Epithele typhae]|uniref:uncharacterized protein n=1 Tax=Epithele typhae TaxID=378194 RepID=UPI002008B5A3|nr:uncharacterized protein BXZ73DRAFT_97285 [Epithele typhae]KAH9943234.1 hypothetical protein BXZ73DRAFT_97285 [Epithele typhae]